MSARSVVLLPPRVASFPPVIALHGLLGAPSSWADLAERLDWPGGVLAPSLPGHGPRPSPVPESFDLAVDELALRVPEGALLLGYSFGGRLALALAARGAPLGGVVVVGAHLGLVSDEERSERVAWEAELAALLRTGDLPGFVDRWEKLDVFATQRGLAPELASAQRKTRLAHDPAALALALERLGTGRMPDLRPRLAGLGCPVLFVAGSLDARYVALGAEAAALSPRVERVVVAGAGHNVTLEAPGALAEFVSARLRAWVSASRAQAHAGREEASRP